MPIYMHTATGNIDTEEGWIESYSAEELEERGLTAVEAFEEDKDETLVEVISNDKIYEASFDSYIVDMLVIVGKKGEEWISLLSENPLSDTLHPAVIISASGIVCIRN